MEYWIVQVLGQEKNKNECKLFLKKDNKLIKGDFFVQIILGNRVNASATKNIYPPDWCLKLILKLQFLIALAFIRLHVHFVIKN